MATFALQLVASDNSANTTLTNLNPIYVQSINPATASDITAFSTALTAVTYIVFEQNQHRTRRLLSSTALATVLSAYSAAQSGVLGAGASGDATLVAGTVAVTVPGVTSSSKVLLTRHTAGGTVTLTVEYFYVVTTNTVTITAAVAAGTINTADTSVITYAIVG